jgi:hypothetical protein
MTASDHAYESPKDRASLVREAGLGRLSFPSILAGVLVAYGAFAVLAALAGTIAGIGSLAAMLVGALLGGVLGERWHSKLTRRAVSGKYRLGRDDQPADHDRDRPAHDQRDRPRPGHKEDSGATRLTSSATQEATAERVSRSRPDR